MPPSKPAKHTFHWREQGPPFELTALLLQGGGALGSYQAGVYQALAEADLHPTAYRRADALSIYPG